MTRFIFNIKKCNLCGKVIEEKYHIQKLHNVSKRPKVLKLIKQNHSGGVKTHTDKTREIISIKNKGKKRSAETRINLSFSKSKEKNPNWRKKYSDKEREAQSQNMIKMWDNAPERKKQLSIKRKELWRNEDWAKETIRKSLKGLFETRPTSLEKQMLIIIKNNNLPYKYTGDGSFLIGYKNPDFINTNGKKICIEVANTIHHKEDYPEKRKAYFKNLGWECFVFRTNKLNEREILTEISQ